MMKKSILIVFLLFIFSSPSQALDIYAQNNDWFVPEQWGFRSGRTLKESYLIDMKPQWEQTRQEWSNPQKPIQSNLIPTVKNIIIYPNTFRIFRVKDICKIGER